MSMNPTDLAFRQALENNDITLVRQLIDEGMDINKPLFQRSESPLMQAVILHYDDMASLLLALGADPALRQPGKETVLHRVAQWENEQAFLQDLLAAGADINAVNELGYTPLHWASAANCPENITFLLTHGANPFLCDNNQKTPRSAAIKNDYAACVDAFDQRERWIALWFLDAPEPAITENEARP